MEKDKELLSKVLDIRDNCEFRYKELDSNNLNECIVIGWDGEDYFDVNVYELAHKCKEFCKNNGIILLSSCEYIYLYDSYNNGLLEYIHRIEVDITEIDAIFKATHWVLENSKDN